MEIREAAQHRWADILVSLGVDQNLLNGRHQSCPICQAGKDRFRWTNHLGTGGYICNQCGHGDGFDLLMNIKGMDFKSVADDVRGVLGQTHARPPQNVDLSKIRAKLQKIWAESKPLSKGCPVHRYLLNRGLAGLDFGSLHGLRCHPGLQYWDTRDRDNPIKGAIYPTMVGLVVTPEGEPATLQTVYLKPEGVKADVDQPRKTMTGAKSYTGGAIRLQSLEPGQTLCVAEGVETALSMKLMYPDVCPWAVISEGSMRKFVPPNDDSNAIYIAGDNDANFVGQAAAYDLAKRLSKAGKIKAEVLLPEKTGADFNDELIAQRAVA